MSSSSSLRVVLVWRLQAKVHHVADQVSVDRKLCMGTHLGGTNAPSGLQHALDYSRSNKLKPQYQLPTKGEAT